MVCIIYFFAICNFFELVQDYFMLLNKMKTKEKVMQKTMKKFFFDYFITMMFTFTCFCQHPYVAEYVFYMFMFCVT